MGIVTAALDAALVVLPGSAEMQREADLLAQELRAVASTLASSRLLLLALSLALLYALYAVFVKPLLYYRRNPDVGYITAPRQTAAERAEEVGRGSGVG